MLFSVALLINTFGFLREIKKNVTQFFKNEAFLH